MPASNNITILKYLVPTLLVVMALYGATISPSISVSDTGLFMMVCDANGIAHPPGYPLATLICHPMMSLDFEGAIPGNLFSALFGVLALGVLYALCRVMQLTGLESALAAGVMGVSAAFWSQSIVLEVYTLNAFLFLCLMLCCARFLGEGDGHWLVAGSLFLGLGLANHWPLIVLSAVCLVPLVFWKPQAVLAVLKRPLTIAGCLFMLMLGLTPYLLMFTKTGNLVTTIGDVNSFEDFWLYASRATFQDDFRHRAPGWLSLLWWVPLMSVKQFGFVGMLLIPIGLWRSMFDLARPFAVSLFVLWLSNCLLLPMLNSVQFNDLSRMYLTTWVLLSAASCSVWFVLGVRWILSLVGLGSPARHLVSILLFAVVAIQSYRLLGPDDADWVEEYNRLLLASLDEGAVLIVAGDTQTGPLGYLHHVQGMRPDVELRQRHNMVFNNRLAHPRTSNEFQTSLLKAYINETDRPVYSVSDPRSGLGPRWLDQGMYFRMGQVGVAIDARLDLYMAALVPALESGAIKEPFVRAYLRNLVYQYARAVVADAVTTEGLSADQLARVSFVSATLPGKIWTLHHLVNGKQSSIDHTQLESLIRAGESQLGSQTTELGARQFLLLAGDAYREILKQPDEAIKRYVWAASYDVNRETCKHLAEKGQQRLFESVGCGTPAGGDQDQG